jgi:hypothetical protein
MAQWTISLAVYFYIVALEVTVRICREVIDPEILLSA